jgi:hypothetical protein
MDIKVDVQYQYINGNHALNRVFSSVLYFDE